MLNGRRECTLGYLPSFWWTNWLGYRAPGGADHTAVLSGAAERTGGGFWRLRGVPRTHERISNLSPIITFIPSWIKLKFIWPRWRQHVGRIDVLLRVVWPLFEGDRVVNLVWGWCEYFCFSLALSQHWRKSKHDGVYSHSFVKTYC